MAQEYKDGDYITDTIWLSMREAIRGNGIFSGLSSSPVTLMTTRLATGSYYSKATLMTVAAPVDSVHSTADPTFDRWDVIYGDDTGQYLSEGIPATAPKPNDIPLEAIILYMVRIRAGVTTITTPDLYNFFFRSNFFDHAQDMTIHRTLPIVEAAITFGGAGHAHTGGAGGAQITYANLGSIPSTFLATQHSLGDTARHSSATLAQVNALISDATLIDTTDSRLSDARVPTIHDHTKHTNRTRIMATPISAVFYEPGESNIPVWTRHVFKSRRYWGWAYPDAIMSPLNEYQFWQIKLPTDYVSGVDIKIQYIAWGSTSTTQVVRLHMEIEGYPTGVTTDPAGGGSFNVDVLPEEGPPATFNYSQIDDLYSITVPANANILNIGIRRDGANGADTYAGNFMIMAVWAEYTADM